MWCVHKVKVFEKKSRVRCICLHFLERALLPHCRLPSHHPTHARPGRWKIDSHVTCLCAPCRSTKVFKLQERSLSPLHSKALRAPFMAVVTLTLRALCILSGEIESIHHEPTVTGGIDRVTIYELLLRHCLSPSIIHCESFLQCACGAESQTRTCTDLGSSPLLQSRHCSQVNPNHLESPGRHLSSRTVTIVMLNWPLSSSCVKS